MPHQVTTPEITAAITGVSPIVLASSTKEQKQLVIALSYSKYGSIISCFKVIQKGTLKAGQSELPIGSTEFHQEGGSHFWIFRFLYDAINHYNNIT